MNLHKKRFQVNRIWARLNKAHTIIWFHRNPMTAEKKQALLQGLFRLDSQAEFFFINSRMFEQTYKEQDIATSELLQRVSQGPNAVIVFPKSAPLGFWKWIQAQNTLIIIAAQITNNTLSCSQKQWYNSQDITRLMALRPIQVYSDLLSVLQIPLLFSSLLNERVNKTTLSTPQKSSN